MLFNVIYVTFLFKKKAELFPLASINGAAGAKMFSPFVASDWSENHESHLGALAHLPRKMRSSKELSQKFSVQICGPSKGWWSSGCTWSLRRSADWQWSRCTEERCRLHWSGALRKASSTSAHVFIHCTPTRCSSLNLGVYMHMSEVPGGNRREYGITYNPRIWEAKVRESPWVQVQPRPWSEF